MPVYMGLCGAHKLKDDTWISERETEKEDRRMTNGDREFYSGDTIAFDNRIQMMKMFDWIFVCVQNKIELMNQNQRKKREHSEISRGANNSIFLMNDSIFYESTFFLDKKKISIIISIGHHNHFTCALKNMVKAEFIDRIFPIKRFFFFSRLWKSNGTIFEKSQNISRYYPMIVLAVLQWINLSKTTNEIYV